MLTSPETPTVPSILVVDDEPLVRGAVIRILGGWGFRVHEAETAQEAMDVLTSLAGERPQLVIIDIILPDDNGVKLAQQIREEFPNQRLLFMSAYTQDVLWSEGLRDSTEVFMAKPFTPADLIRKVEEALTRPSPSAIQSGSG
jgi:CheY-like chemotaxis protein